MAATGTVPVERDGVIYTGYWTVQGEIIVVTTSNGGYEKAALQGAKNYEALAKRLLSAIVSRGEA